MLIFEKVAELYAEIVGIDDRDITSETELMIDPKAYRINIAKLIIACEKKFNITIFDEDVHGFKCIGDIAEYIDKLVSEDAASALSTDKEREAWYYR